MQRAVAHLSGLLGITMVLNSVQPVISGTHSLILNNNMYPLPLKRIRNRNVNELAPPCRRCGRRRMASSGGVH